MIAFLWILAKPVYAFAAPLIGPVISWFTPWGNRARRLADRSGLSLSTLVAIAAVVCVGLVAWRFFHEAPKRPKMVTVTEVELKLRSAELSAVRRAHDELNSAYQQREQFVMALKDEVEKLRLAQKGDRDAAPNEDNRVPVFRSDDKWLRRKRARTR